MYRDEAADLMAAAARGGTRPAPPELELTARRAAPDIRPEIKRPLPYPEPVGINDNVDDVPADTRQAPRTTRRRLSFLQAAARVVIAPWYATVAATAIGIDILFIKSLLGL